jgi:membrane protease subunit HflC
MKKSFLMVVGIVLIVAAITAYSSVFTVNQINQALILQFGDPVRVVKKPGLKFKLPFIQNVEYYDRRILNLDPPSQEVPLLDQKRINVDSFARYRIVDPLEFKKRAVTQANFRQVFGGRLNSAVRTEVAKVLLSDLLTTKRNQVMERITEKMRTQAPSFGVEMVDVRIGRTDLPETTSKSVYNRMRSERVAQAAQLRAQGAELKAKIEADANRTRTIIIADAQKISEIQRGIGEGERNRILGAAYGKDEKFFDFYRSMIAYRKSLATKGTTMVLSPDSDFFRFFASPEGMSKKVISKNDKKGTNKKRK